MCNINMVIIITNDFCSFLSFAIILTFFFFSSLRPSFTLYCKPLGLTVYVQASPSTIFQDKIPPILIFDHEVHLNSRGFWLLDCGTSPE